MAPKPQTKQSTQGFSFRGDGPLDMRMQGGTGGQTEAEAAPTGLTAADIVNTWEVGALTKVLKEYGEEPRAYKLARAMVAARPLESTAALRAVVEQHTPYADRPKTLARVFQVRVDVDAGVCRIHYLDAFFVTRSMPAIDPTLDLQSTTHHTSRACASR